MPASAAGEVILVTSAGFAGRSRHQPLGLRHRAGRRRHRDAARLRLPLTVHLADLDDPAAIGRSAGERAVARLNPTRPKTAKVPVVYDPRVAGVLIGHFVGAINGASVARGTSFLKDKMGEQSSPPASRPRRPAPGARPALPRVRRRGHADRSPCADRGRRADHLAAGQPLGTPAWPGLDGPRRARTGGPPSPSPPTCISRRAR